MENMTALGYSLIASRIVIACSLSVASLASALSAAISGAATLILRTASSSTRRTPSSARLTATTDDLRLDSMVSWW